MSAKMIRYYESIGLVSAAERSGSGYRVYGEADIHLLRFIRRGRELGFSIPRITELVALWRDRGRSSADVRRIAQAHIAELEQKIDELRAMVTTLDHLVDHCHGDQRPECPILDDLAEGHPRAPSPSTLSRA